MSKKLIFFWIVKKKSVNLHLTRLALGVAGHYFIEKDVYERYLLR